MSHRAPLTVLALVCGFIAVMRPLLIRAAESPAEQRQRAWLFEKAQHLRARERILPEIARDLEDSDKA
jgi:hypothetical protein